MSFLNRLNEKYTVIAGDVVDFPPKKQKSGLTSTSVPAFTDGKYLKAKDKELVYKAMVNFVKNDFAQAKFTKSLYNFLSLHFGFIAHYDLGGFYQKRFADPEGRIDTYKAISHPSSYDLNNEDAGDLIRAFKDLVSKNEKKFVEDAHDLKKQMMLEQHGKLTRELEKMGHKF